MPALREQACFNRLRPTSKAVCILPAKPPSKPLPITSPTRLSIILMDSSLVTYFGRNLLRFPAKGPG
jgi:hypothetical protein